MDQSQSEFVVIDPYVDEDLLDIFASLDPKLYPFLPIYTQSLDLATFAGLEHFRVATGKQPSWCNHHPS
jgi:hypothetical protein